MTTSADSTPSLARRAGAYAIDAVIAGVVTSVVTGVAAIVWLTAQTSPLVVVAAAWAGGFAWLLIYTAMQGGRGSLGQRARGLRLVRQDAAARPIGFARALLRNIVWGLACAVVVGYFTPLFDRSGRRQGWHDRAAGSVMMDAAPSRTGSPAESGTEQGAAPALAPHAGAGTDAPSDEPLSFLPPGPVLPPPFASVGPPPVPTDAVAPASVAPPAPAYPVPAVPATGLISHVPGVTSQDSAATPPALTPPAPAPVAPPVPPAPDGPTARPTHAASTDELALTRIASGERALVTLVWDDGAHQAVYGRTVFGRNPAPETGALTAAVRDETLSLSKTHFEIGAGDDGTPYVLDRHSTNGVVLVRSTERQRAEAGVRLAVRAGDVLEFGDRRLSIEVPA
ncbi:MAG: hypothetical protein DI573_02360 [Microbacterium sp.]|uniref:RDD family protein n=1 Tax=Microbacterium sp. TaxID=51671 RepID=UPI000DB3EE64|nr:RDD family protein [Microbacterium sp.]PZU41017.1 MAG: hypothetical protein DI573_02360 [Microbacterium sp.]